MDAARVGGRGRSLHATAQQLVDLGLDAGAPLLRASHRRYRPRNTAPPRESQVLVMPGSTPSSTTASVLSASASSVAKLRSGSAPASGAGRMYM